MSKNRQSAVGVIDRVRTSWHTEIEEVLTSYEFTWQYLEDFDVDEIDDKLSMMRQARQFSLDGGAIDRYAAAYERGEDLPPLVCYMDAEGHIICASGNHRRKAAKQAGVNVPVYLITDGNPEAISDLPIIFNIKNGVPLSPSEIRVVALRKIANNVPAEHIMRVTGLNRKQVDHLAEELRAEDTLRRLDLDGEQLRRTDRVRITQLRSDGAIEAAYRLLSEVGDRVTTTEFSDLVTKANATKDEASQIAIIAARQEELLAARPEVPPVAREKGGRRVIVRSKQGPKPLAKLKAAVSNIRTVGPTKLAVSLRDDQKEEALSAIEEGITLLRQMRMEIEG